MLLENRVSGGLPVYENLGATPVVPVVPEDTSLHTYSGISLVHKKLIWTFSTQTAEAFKVAPILC